MFHCSWCTKKITGKRSVEYCSTFETLEAYYSDSDDTEKETVEEMAEESTGSTTAALHGTLMAVTMAPATLTLQE